MELDITVSGSMTSIVGWEQRLGLMVLLIKANTIMVRKTEKENLFLLMVLSMKELLEMMSLTALEFINGVTAKCMKVNGSKIKCMEKEFYLGQMENNTPD